MRRAAGVASLIAVMAAAAALWAQQRSTGPREETIPGPPVTQPVAFSHKLHVANGLTCGACHPIGGEGFQAGIPKESFCLGCHGTIKADSPEIAKLKKPPVEWKRVYQLPDWIWFNHASHVKSAKLECGTCHGEVATRDVLFKEKSTSMGTCMDCHAQKRVSNGCDFCHASQ